jgi:hypothetical protein
MFTLQSLQTTCWSISMSSITGTEVDLRTVERSRVILAWMLRTLAISAAR